MYPKTVKESKQSYFDLFIDIKDFLVDSVKSFRSPRSFIMFLHKNFHF